MMQFAVWGFRFARQLWACAKLAIKTQLEYRFNLFADVALQPVLGAVLEMAVWVTILKYTPNGELGGFKSDSYLSYALWASFLARVNSSWMYEFKMIDEIDQGTVNAILVRPLSFYNYYLGQFMGYKVFTGLLSVITPLVLTYFMHLPMHLERLPMALALSFYYLILVHTLSFCVASMAFFFNRVHSIGIAKNVMMWFFSGELFPLDLVPGTLKSVMLWLPFSAAAYTPVGYLIGRVESPAVYRGFFTITVGIFVSGVLGAILWSKGRRAYAGTGA